MSGANEPGYLESRTMKTETPTVKMIAISADEAGQRIDNFLRTQLKGVPKSMIYRILRKGEVRVNKKRIKPEYKLEAGDEVRQWLEEGAAIYICGSLQGMAAGVDQALTQMLGIEAVDTLIEQGRYRRDVY